MFGFSYFVDLKVVHPNLDPKVVTQALRLTPRLRSKSGEELFDVGGKPRGRRAALSCWSCRLHRQKVLDSSRVTVDDFLASWIPKLKPHLRLFSSINRERGEAKFSVGWLAASSYSTEVFTPKTLQECGDLGIGLEVNMIVGEQFRPGEASAM